MFDLSEVSEGYTDQEAENLHHADSGVAYIGQDPKDGRYSDPVPETDPKSRSHQSSLLLEKGAK